MLDKNVGDALLKLDLSPQTDPPTSQVERIIDADQRRVKRWTRDARTPLRRAAQRLCATFRLRGAAASRARVSSRI